MAGLHELPRPHVSEWEPEPLYLPVEDPVEERYRRDRVHPHDERDEDLPGSHVIVLDLA
jgi:hypothetical protein